MATTTRSLRSAALAIAAAACALPLLPAAALADDAIVLNATYPQVGDDGSTQQWAIDIFAYDGRGGSPSLTVRRCPPDQAAPCETVMTSVEPRLRYPIPWWNEPARGTTWELTATVGERSTTVRTPAWRGTLTATSRPSLSGTPVAGPTARPSVATAPARWNYGGIGSLLHTLQLQACTDTSGRDCAVLSESTWVLTELEPIWDPAPQTVPERYVGRMLRAVDQLTPFTPPKAGEQPPPMPSLPPVELRTPAQPGILAVASDWVGPVAAEPVAPVERTPPPVATRARVRIARTLYLRGPRTLASVRCSQACAVRVAIRGGRRSVTVTRRAAAGRALAITLPARALRRLGAETLRTTVAVDGRTVARGATRLAPRLRDRLRLR